MELEISDDPGEIERIEKSNNIKNKWNFNWLSENVEVNGAMCKVGESIKKVRQAGTAKCILCNKFIKYGSTGKKALKLHLLSENHKQAETNKRENQSIAAYLSSDVPEAKISSNVPSVRIVPLIDQIASQEILVASLLAEHSLPFKMGQVIVECAQMLSRIPKALAKLQMKETAAAYKLKHGVAFRLQRRQFEALKKRPFSLNIDEATSRTKKKVLSVLASFVDDDGKSNVVHLSSVEMYMVTARSLLNKLSDLLEENGVPWGNLVSVLMDSCNVMRGRVGGFETLIRSEKCIHLLDIDGDSCHHIHNACKQFCKPFDKYLEQFMDDIHCEYKWSPDQDKYLQQICDVMNIPYTTPAKCIPHRWLSSYDCSLSTNRLLPALQVLHFGFMTTEDRILYKNDYRNLLSAHDVCQEDISTIKKIHSYLRKKSLTKAGKDRKGRLTKKMYYQRLEIQALLDTYIDILPRLKEYVMTFQSGNYLVCELHARQAKLFIEFLSFFTQPACLISKTAAELQTLPLESHMLAEKDLYLPLSVRRWINNASVDNIAVKAFLGNLSQAYLLCGQALQKKLPLRHPVLTALGSLDPSNRGKSSTRSLLRQLMTTHLRTFLNPEVSFSKLDEEARKFNIDMQVTALEKNLVDPNTANLNMLIFWNHPLIKREYPHLFCMAQAAFTIFHGPKVESSFSKCSQCCALLKQVRMLVLTVLCKL